MLALKQNCLQMYFHVLDSWDDLQLIASKELQATLTVIKSLKNLFIDYGPRKKALDWMFTVQTNSKLSLSSLYDAISILDRLISNGQSIATTDLQLICGTLLMISSKMNEKTPITINKINSLARFPMHKESFIIQEATILAKLGFNAAAGPTAYSEMRNLMHHQHRNGLNELHEFEAIQVLKLAIYQPQRTMIYGERTLAAAIISLWDADYPSGQLNKDHVTLIRIQLQKIIAAQKQ